MVISNDHQLNNINSTTFQVNDLTANTIITSNFTTDMVTENGITYRILIGYAPSEFATTSAPNSFFLNNAPNLPNDPASSILTSLNTTLILPANAIILNMYISNNGVPLGVTNTTIALSTLDDTGTLVTLASAIGAGSTLPANLNDGLVYKATNAILGTDGSLLIPVIPQINNARRITLGVASAPMTAGDLKIMISYMLGLI